MGYRVEEVEGTATWDLRLRVLSNPSPSPADDQAGVVHFAALDDEGVVVGVATVYPEDTSLRPGRRAYRLRGMAVEPERQGRGIGQLVLDTVVARCRAEGAEVLWADGRDPALPFYERVGFAVVGDGFAGAHGIPHHVVIRDL